MTIDYERIAQRDLRKQSTPDEHRLLRLPESLDAWWGALCSIKTGVELQLASHRARWPQRRKELMDRKATDKTFDMEYAWLQFKVEEATWRARTLKFLSVVEDTMRECKALRQATHAQHSDATDVYKLHRLRDAIVHHRLKFADDSDVEPDPADEELWAVIDEVS